jgi:hypothetical protein
MNNNSKINEAILGLIRVSKFGSVDGEDVVCGLEEHSHLWTLVVPGRDVGRESQLLDLDSGVLMWNELRILTHRQSYLDLYELTKNWRPKFLGVGFLDRESVEILVMWES